MSSLLLLLFYPCFPDPSHVQSAGHMLYFFLSLRLPLAIRLSLVFVCIAVSGSDLALL